MDSILFDFGVGWEKASEAEAGLVQLEVPHVFIRVFRVAVREVVGCAGIHSQFGIECNTIT